MGIFKKKRQSAGNPAVVNKHCKAANAKRETYMASSSASTEPPAEALETAKKLSQEPTVYEAIYCSSCRGWHLDIK